MAMVLNTNEQATRIHSIYNRNVGQMNAAMTRIATTQKINSAKDGAANWAISEKMRERIRANNQANQNIQNDTALLKTAQDGFNNTLNVLQTLKERAINSANDANITGDRTKIVEEVKQLVAQIDDNAAKVKFNGRQLLNGASEVSETTAAAATKKTATAANVNAVTATEPQGTHSVYSIQGLKVYDATEHELRDLASSDTSVLLADLKDAEGNKLFKDGDKITVSWNDNGEAKQATYTVDSDNSTVSDLVGILGGSGVAGESFVAGSILAAGDAIETAASAADVKNAAGTAITADDAGIYLIAKDSNRKITDVAISVTNSDASEADRLANTNAVLEPTGVMQNASRDGFKSGSNLVYAVEGALGTTNYVFGDLGDKTQWMDLKHTANYTGTDGKEYIYNTHVSSNPADASSVSIKLEINDKTLTFTGDTTIEQLNQLFKDNDINVRAHIVQAQDVLTYDGKEVTKGDSTSTSAYRAEKAGLYFIAGEGETITKMDFTIDNGTASAADTNKFKLDKLKTTVDGSNTTAYNSTPAAGSSAFGEKLKVNSDYVPPAVAEAVSTTATKRASIDNSDSMLPQGDALQFYIGGESNFGVNFTFGKATTETLFGMTGEKFAAMFQDTKGAEEALGYIDDAINKTLVEQTRLGAMEARLGYTSENLTSMNTNLEAGVGAYRDADIAKEMTDYMKYSVLAQSSQYMLAQATQNPFSVLQLLQP